MKDTDIRSYHIFMFPFSLHHEWNEEIIGKMLNRKGWVRKQFDYRSGDFASNFSEMSYFYEFSSGAMFDDPGSMNRVMSAYSMPLGTDASYIIKVNKYGNKSIYKLHLNKIDMNVYDDKAAILSFHLANTEYTDFQDILNINDFGRRIYPQFLANDKFGRVDLQITKNSFLADCIEIDLDNGHSFSDDFSFFGNSPVQPFVLPKYIKGLLPDEMHDCKWLLDDRMYVVSMVCDNDTVESMKTLSYTREEIAKSYGNKYCDNRNAYRKWYQYVFVDNSDETCVNPEMFGNLLSEATYTRWSTYGTLYGISRYSFVCLANVSDFSVKLTKDIKTMYYRMASLALAQRALALYYSREISQISKDLDEKKTLTKELRKRVDELNRDYLRFVNNIYFREVTSQDQGIELYELMQKQMNIKRDEEGLSGEIEQLHNYIEMKNDDRRNEEMGCLTWIATLFLPATFVTGMFGMNPFDNPFNGSHFAWQLVGAVAFTLFAYLILHNWKKRRK